MEPFRSYIARFLTRPDELKSQLVWPVLLFEPEATPPEGEPISEEYRLRTASGAGLGTHLGATEAVVILVKKTKDNAFQRGVTVGRTGNNDIVLDDPSVSRFHAWFQRDERGGWTVADAGSKNGTTVSGTRLKSKKPMRIPDMARVRFGEVTLTLFLPERFFSFLEGRVGG